MTDTLETWSAQIRDLGAGDSLTLHCAPCQSTVQWTKADLVLAVGPRTELHNIGFHERLRCRGCGRAPSSVWQAR
jgi:hypothetical protein